MDLYITVGPGNHLHPLYHTNDSVLENQTWGNNLDPLEYEITITKVTTEIGEEPWFAPSDEAKFWGSTVLDDSRGRHDATSTCLSLRFNQTSELPESGLLSED